MAQLMSLIPREKRMMHELKRHATVQEWQQLQEFIGEFLGLKEGQAVSDDQIEDLVVKIGKELKAAGKIKTAPTDVDLSKIKKDDKSGIETTESKKPLHEDFVLALALAAPTLLNLIAKLIEWVYSKIAMSEEEQKAYKEEGAAYAYAKKTGKTPDGKAVSEEELEHMEEKLYKTKAGKFIHNAAHGLHSLYVSPLRLILAALEYGASADSWLTCWKNSKKPAEVLYCIVMIGVAGYGIVHALPAITGFSAATITPIATAVVDAVKGGDMSAELIKSIVSSLNI